ncbi:alpha/beta-type small acid-soluble spore protein [Clostridium coskatii]|uniref:Small, acid-soluble spore protein C2 n=1 Tax=Clostridium coskatii TaxID=1705578 RepID=A0A166TNF2_9CLOT|nr:alpha/beta-type small acid-soluble spore protein [Clostridium coskatii]OAA93899.1 Small, acid-soluble spore protein C2 [Clostridium coskatii]OBR95228.1 small, acid-soluble spore protein C2 [Clostridium coskatii]
MSRRPLVPEAKPKLDKLKTKYSNEFGMEFNDSYKGNKASKLNGHNGGLVGGLMTKKMVEEFEKNLIDK